MDQHQPPLRLEKRQAQATSQASSPPLADDMRRGAARIRRDPRPALFEKGRIGETMSALLRRRAPRAAEACRAGRLRRRSPSMPFGRRFCRQRAARGASRSTKVSRGFAAQAATMRPTAPVAGAHIDHHVCRAATRPPRRAGPRRCRRDDPAADWRRRTRPPSSVSCVVSVMPQFGPRARHSAISRRACGHVLLRHQDAARKGADHPLQGAHMACPRREPGSWRSPKGIVGSRSGRDRSCGRFRSSGARHLPFGRSAISLAASIRVAA